MDKPFANLKGNYSIFDLYFKNYHSCTVVLNDGTEEVYDEREYTAEDFINFIYDKYGKENIQCLRPEGIYLPENNYKIWFVLPFKNMLFKRTYFV